METASSYLCCADIVGLQLDPNTVIKTDVFTLTNSADYIFKNVITDSDIFFKKFGEVTTLGFGDSNHCFLFNHVTNNRQDFIHLNNNFISSLLSQLWSIRDCGVFVMHYFYLPDFITFAFLQGRLNFNFYNSKGQTSQTYFSVEEILSLYPSLVNRSKFITGEQLETPSERLGAVDIHTQQSTIYNNLSRLHRAQNFIINARKLSMLPIRITNYISFLECLFSTSDRNVSHNVSHRTSLFLKRYNANLNQEHIYKFVKKCYSIRSNYIHGSRLKNQYSQNIDLENISQQLDDICRTVLNVIYDKEVDTFNNVDRKIDDYFKI